MVDIVGLVFYECCGWCLKMGKNEGLFGFFFIFVRCCRWFWCFLVVVSWLVFWVRYCWVWCVLFCWELFCIWLLYCDIGYVLLWVLVWKVLVGFLVCWYWNFCLFWVIGSGWNGCVFCLGLLVCWLWCCYCWKICWSGFCFWWLVFCWL